VEWRAAQAEYCRAAPAFLWAAPPLLLLLVIPISRGRDSFLKLDSDRGRRMFFETENYAEVPRPNPSLLQLRGIVNLIV
jgi:hypothetical protein